MRQFWGALCALLVTTATFGETAIDPAKIQAHLDALDFVRYNESQLDEAKLYLRDQLIQLGYEVSEVSSTRSGAQGTSESLSARIPGTTHTCLIAHYDTVSGSRGAADNASGVAALLEVARIAKQWVVGDRGVVFLFPTFEENGLQGSNDWLAAGNADLCDKAVSLDEIAWECSEPGCGQPYVDVSIQWCALGTNVDFEPECSGGCTGTHVNVVANTDSVSLSNELQSYLIEQNRPVVSAEVRGFCDTYAAFRRSDHANFWDEGIPAVLLSTGATDRSTCYHTGGDTQSCPEWSMDILLDTAQGLLSWLAADLEAVTTSDTASQPLHIGDFNGDSRADVLLRDSSQGDWAMALLDGFVEVEQGTPEITRNADFALEAIADFNGDGNDDVVVRSRSQGSWRMFLMDGIGRIAAANPPVNGSEQFALMAAEDFNGDGKTDLLLRHVDTGSWRLFLMDGFDVTSVGNIAVPHDPSLTWIAFEDFDGDQDLDVLVRDSETGAWQSFLLEGLAPADAASLALPTDLAVKAAHVGDFDGNGKADILLHDSASAIWTMYLIDGLEIRESAPVSVAPSEAFTLQLVGDFDGSGSQDLLLRDESTGDWHMALMDGLEITSQGTPVVNRSLDFRPIAARDFNGDGTADILLWDPNSDTWRLFLMNGLSRLDVGNLPVDTP